MKAKLLTTLLIATTLTAGADEISGPNRLTLADESWGSLYYVPSTLKDYKYTRDAANNRREMTSRFGKFTILDSGIGAYEISGPKASLKVEGTASEVKVTFQGKNFEFRHDADTLQMIAPNDRLTYRVQGPIITSEGKFGKTTITEKGGNYTVTSPKGGYSYTPTADGGFEVHGGPLRQHPGLFRGALFEVGGLGIFVDFRKMDPVSPLFRFLDFAPLLEYH